MDFPNFSLSRPEAANVVGWTDAQLKNYQTRYDLFPEKREGTGRHAEYDFGDLMKAGAVAQMIEDGFSPSAAADAFSSYTVIGTLLDNDARFSLYPGTFFLTKNHEGHWVGADHPGAPSRYEVRLWPLFDKIWPRYVDAVLTTGGYARYSAEERKLQLDQYYEWMKEVRGKRRSA